MKTVFSRQETGTAVFVDVAIGKGSGDIFTYSVPRELSSAVCPGKRVLVPLGSRRHTGCIVGIPKQTSREKLRDIISVLDEEPLFDEQDLSFFRWASRYYLYPPGKALGVILPSGIDVRSTKWVMPTGCEPAETDRFTGEQRRLLAALSDFPAGCALQTLTKACGRTSLEKDLKHLAGRGLLTLEERLQPPKVRRKNERIIRLAAPSASSEPRLTEKQRAVLDLIESIPQCTLSLLSGRIKNAADTVKRLEKKGFVLSEEREIYREPAAPPSFGREPDPLQLNEDQAKALDAILRAVEKRDYAPFLLHGVTGSGKTEVYLRAIASVLDSGGDALLMVPEIALTGQLIDRVRRRFDDRLIALYHSGLSEGERYDQWRKMQRGAARILIGTRSAVFVPIRDLRLIIVDEEHDASYKQDDRLPYNARDLAVVLGRFHDAPVVLGSATPDLQTYYNTRHRGFTCLKLPNRVENRPLPAVTIVDMKQPGARRGKNLLLSSPLATAIEETLTRGDQSLLLLNRRGFTTFLYCGECGHVFTCANCSVTMTHHMSQNLLKCHYCDYSIKAPPLCPVCKSGKILSFGAGTEKLHEEVTALFPHARTARLDSDVTSKRGSYETILSALYRREIDILVGTQMIAKGHDIPHVTLVGVVSADGALNIPDFRAAERTFQILTQVSGRGGRGRDPGRVFIQTINPDNPSIQRARNHDYDGFYHDEIFARRELGFPPFQRLINIRVSSPSEEKAAELARLLADTARSFIAAAKDKMAASVLGPAEPPLARIKGSYRRQILLKGPDTVFLHETAERVLKAAGRRASEVRIDVDPLNFM